MRRAALLLTAAIGAACAREPPARPDAGRADPGGGDAGLRDVEPSDPSDPEGGAAIYARQCASCHGPRGAGQAPIPALDRWTRDRAALVAIIAARMPPTAPGQCAGPCAERVADYVLAALQRPPPAACEPARRSPRQLRLLTRREYAATIRDLFGDCRLRTFVYTPPSGPAPTSVVVAGSFNGWSPTTGWPLAREGARWVLRQQVPDGHHEYKLVVDGTTWLTDPTNPRTAPDGFGGSNSVLEVDCAREVDPWTLTAAFPPETRPPGFPFDDHAEAGTMTIVRLDEHWAAARAIAAQRAARVADAAGCVTGDLAACADRVIDGWIRRGLRRPLEASERDAYRAHLRSGPGGVERALRALLSSPHFLYKSELGLDPYEIASALSYGLWGTLPDDALLERAATGGLADRAGVEAAVRAMLADPRARPVLETFAAQWLGIERVLTADKRTDGYAAYDLPLRQALVQETSRLFAHVVLDGSHTLDELFTADYSLAGPEIARLYDLPAPSGERLSLAGTPRRGILGHGSVLAAYAYSDQSSPVRRGVFVRERLLCQHFGVPPPNAGGIPAVDPGATTRERFQQHSADPACASCHQSIDPIGFGFERFDALGRARDSEAGRPIDARGDLTDVEGLGTGTHAPFTSLAELGQILAGSHAAQACLATQYYRFARGVTETPCSLDDVIARFAATGDIRELIVAVYTSPAFLERE